MRLIALFLLLTCAAVGQDVSISVFPVDDFGVPLLDQGLDELTTWRDTDPVWYSELYGGYFIYCSVPAPGQTIFVPYPAPDVDDMLDYMFSGKWTQVSLGLVTGEDGLTYIVSWRGMRIS